MKKTIIALMGLFTLMACSDEAVYQADEISSSTVNNNNPPDIGGNVPFTIDMTYNSQWDQYTRSVIPTRASYVFNNVTHDYTDPTKRLIFRVTPYIGLAYYDTILDGFYTDLQSGTPVANFNLGNHPHLFAGSNEVGNFIPSQTLTLSGFGPSDVDMSIVSDTYHCPVLDGNGGVSNAGRYFNILSANANTAERQLLAEYGKVFFYYWEAIDPVTFVVAGRGYITPEFDDSLNQKDILTPSLTVALPGLPTPVSSVLLHTISQAPTLNPMIYPPATNGQSMELVFEHNTYPFADTFNYKGVDYYVRANSDITSTDLTLARY